MQKKYKIHGLSWSQHETDVTLPNGEVTKGHVKCLVSELIPVDHMGSSVVHRFIGNEADEIAAHHHVGDIVSHDFVHVAHHSDSEENE